MSMSAPAMTPLPARIERMVERGVVLGAAVTYVVTAARTVQGGDSGELAAVGSGGGVAHPPGYPLYVLWLRVTSWLPAASPAHRTALATAILGALTIAMLQMACRAWGASRGASAIASAMLACSPLMWRLATETEVFALNALIALALVWLAAPAPRRREAEIARVLGLGLLAGLGISNHHTIVLLFPLGIAAALYGVLRAPARGRALLAGVGGLVAGLSPYGYLVYATRTTPLDSGCIWGDARDASGLLHHFFRVDYGTSRLAVSDRPPEPLAQLALLGETLLDSGIALLLCVGFVSGGVALARRRPWPKLLAALIASFVLAGPLLVTRFNLSPRGLHASVVERFHLFPLALGCVLGAVALTRPLERARERLRLAVVALVPFAAVIRGLWSYDVVAEHHRPTTEQWLYNVARLLPDRAIVLAQGDDTMGAFLYARCALGLRPDVDVVAPHLLLTEPYARRASARLGFELERGIVLPGETEPALRSGELLAQVLATGRPVFINAWFARGLEESAPSYPVGPLIRIVPTWGEVPEPSRLLELNEAAFHAMQLEERVPPRGTWAGARFKDYARPWYVLATAFEREGDHARAERCRARAQMLTPR